MSNNSLQRIDSLTSLRGVLAIWVVLYHFSNDIIKLMPEMSFFEFILRKGHFAVPGFFILSGYVLTYTHGSQFYQISYKKLIKFWLLRLARIYPVHLATLCMVLVMVIVANRTGFSPNDSSGYSTRDFVLNLFLIQTWVKDFSLNWNYPSWSISSEWFAYLLFPFICTILPYLKAPVRSIVLGIASVAASIVVYSLPQFPFRELICVVPTFIAGVAIGILRINCLATTFDYSKWLPDIFVVLLIIGCTIRDEGGVALVILSLFCLIWSLSHLINHCHSWWLWKPLVYSGEVSYSLYMTHTLAQKFLYKILPSSAYEQASDPIRGTVLLVYAVVIVVICLGVYYFIEKPSHERIRTRMKRSG